MTVTRLGQITAETASPGEFLRDGQGSPVLDSSVPRTGNYCWGCAGGPTTTPGFGLSFAPQVGVRGNFAFRYAAMGAYGIYLLRIDAGTIANVQAAVFFDNNNDLKFYINSVLVATVAQGVHGLSPNTWFDIGFYYMSGAPGEFALYVNGASVYAYTGTLAADIDNVFVLSTGGSLLIQITDPRFDDLYVDGLTVGEINAAPSARRFLPSRPTAQSTVTWSPYGAGTNIDAINETIPDDDVSYVRTQVAGDQDLYQMQAVVLPSNYKIRAVIPTMIVRKGDAGIDARLSGVLYDGLNTSVDTARTVQVAYRQAWGRFAAQPDGTQWTEGDYASMLAGYKSDGTF